MNIKIIPFNAVDQKTLRALWNQSYGTQFPLCQHLWESRVVSHRNFSIEHSFVAYYNNEIAGFIATKVHHDFSESKKLQGHIVLFFIPKGASSEFVGEKLLEVLHNSFSDTAVSSIHFGKDMDHLFPGLPQQFESLLPIFMAQGYRHEGTAYDLMHDVKYQASFEIERKSQYLIREAHTHDAEALQLFFNNHFPGRWAEEFSSIHKKGSPEVKFFLAFENHRIVGFCRLNAANAHQIVGQLQWQNLYPNLMGIGPLGVIKTHEKQGIASHLIETAMAEAYRSQASHIVIDWTGHIDFYERFGFRVSQRYSALSKTLRG